MTGKKLIIVSYIGIFIFSLALGFIRGYLKNQKKSSIRQTKKVEDCTTALSNLNNKKEEIQKRSVFILKDCDGEKIINSLINLIKTTKNPEIKRYAYFALIDRESQRIKNTFLKCLESEDKNFMDICFYGISQYQITKRELPIIKKAIMKSLYAKDPDIVNSAILLIGKLKLKNFFSNLHSLYKETHNEITKDLILQTMLILMKDQINNKDLTIINKKQAILLIDSLIKDEKDENIKKQLYEIKKYLLMR